MSESPQSRPCFNDSRISDDETLYRHVRGDQLEPFDLSPHGCRPASSVFRDVDMSVDRAALRPLADVIQARPHMHVAAITAKEVRDMGYSVWWDPKDDNPAHSIVCPRLTTGQAKMIVKRPDILCYYNTAFPPKNRSAATS